jgi:hypothetical protein
MTYAQEMNGNRKMEDKCMHLNFSILVASLYMVTTFDEIADELARTRASKLCRVVLLLN